MQLRRQQKKLLLVVVVEAALVEVGGDLPQAATAHIIALLRTPTMRGIAPLGVPMAPAGVSHGIRIHTVELELTPTTVIITTATTTTTLPLLLILLFLLHCLLVLTSIILTINLLIFPLLPLHPLGTFLCPNINFIILSGRRQAHHAPRAATLSLAATVK